MVPPGLELRKIGAAVFTELDMVVLEVGGSMAGVA